MGKRYSELVERLMMKLKPGFGGAARPEFVAEISALTREIEDESGQDGYIRQKTGRVREWVGIVCSAHRYALWGLSVVENFAYQNAYRLQRPPER